MKGIILAGGRGTRLYPMTEVSSKQLQPIYDKPMIYYPLATLMLAGIKDVLIISTPRDTPMIETLLSDGSRWGINIQYMVQKEPKGIAEAFIYGEEFIGNDSVCLILGDNLFHGNLDFLRRAMKENTGGTIFAYQVNDPERYGVVEISKNGEILSIQEKPKNPKSNLAIPGLYIFNSEVARIAKNITPSARGELEITEIQNYYLKENSLNVERMGRGMAWLDTGTAESLLEAGQFIHALEKRQGIKVACLEEIALTMGYYNDREDFLRFTSMMPDGPYKEYCIRIYKENE